MFCIYKLTETTVADESGNTHSAFGIALYQDESGQPTRVIDSIFTDRITAEDFVSLCNRLELSPDHLDDVIDDTLAVMQ